MFFCKVIDNKSIYACTRAGRGESAPRPRCSRDIKNGKAVKTRRGQNADFKRGRGSEASQSIKTKQPSDKEFPVQIVANNCKLCETINKQRVLKKVSGVGISVERRGGKARAVYLRNKEIERN